jgi:periplasmic divalent cation tolerance protein
MKPIIILCTAPSLEVAKSLCKKLVESSFVACGQILPGITSIYTWEQKYHEESEILMLLKTTESNFKSIEEFILTNHPYSVPEIISISIADITPKYANWLNSNTIFNTEKNG